jgi:type I restriction enzyme, S subunit
MNGWQLCSIEEVCLRVTSGGTPSRRNPAFYQNGTVEWIKTGELKDWFVEEVSERITEEAISHSSAKVFPTNTVLMAMYGDGRTIGSLGMLRRPAATNQACCAMIVNEKKCLPKFLLYSLLHHRRSLISLALGGAQRNLNGKTIRAFKINIPPLKLQRKIAAILSAYDDLIENNTRRIQMLEEMARRIYEEWFVRYRFPGHENVRLVESELGLIPNSWKVQGLYDLSELTYGFPFKSKLFNSNGGSIGIVRIRDIRTDKASAYTNEPFDQKYLLSDGDLLIGMDGEFHMGRWAGGKAALNQRVVMLRPKGNLSKYFLFLLIENPIKHLEATIVGTTVAHLSAKDLKSMKLITPSDDILKVIGPLFDSIFKQEIALRKKNKVLRRTRDLLLPKLILGEVDVSSFPEPE